MILVAFSSIENPRWQTQVMFISQCTIMIQPSNKIEKKKEISWWRIFHLGIFYQIKARCKAGPSPTFIHLSFFLISGHPTLFLLHLQRCPDVTIPSLLLLLSLSLSLSEDQLHQSLKRKQSSSFTIGFFILFSGIDSTHNRSIVRQCGKKIG